MQLLHDSRQEIQDVVVLTAALDACAKALQVRAAESLFKRTVPNTRSCGIMINMYSRLRKTREAEALLEAMPGLCLHPNVITYTALLTGYSMKAEWQKALALLDQITEKCHNVSKVQWQITFNVAMAACARAGEAGFARMLFDRMVVEMKVEPINAHYNTLLASCIRLCDTETAYKLFREMKACGLQPRIEEYNTLLRCYRQVPDEAHRLFAEAEASGLSANIDTANALLAACLEGSDHLRAQVAQEMLRERGLVPNSKTAELLGALRASEAAGQLPAGWASALDPSSGRAYYWRVDNPAATTTWTRP